MKILFNLLLLFSFSARADNIKIFGFGSGTRPEIQHTQDWCGYSVGSTENMTVICGVGSGSDESAAMKSALDQGLNEFKQTCELSSACKDRPRTVEVGRSECGVDARKVICHRLIRVTFLR